MRKYAEDVLSGKESAGPTPYPSFFAVTSIDASAPPPQFQSQGENALKCDSAMAIFPSQLCTAANGEIQSTFYSVWYNKDNNLGGHANATGLAGGYMDNIWRSIWRSSTKYQALYMAL